MIGQAVKKKDTAGEFLTKRRAMKMITRDEPAF